MREQVELLKHHPHTAADVVDRLGPFDRGDVPVLEQDLPVIRGLEQVDAAQQRRLARTARPDHADHAAARDLEVDSAQDVQATEPLVDVFEFERERARHADAISVDGVAG
jgi:hypothetical protein